MEVELYDLLEKNLLAKRLGIAKPKLAKQLLHCVPYLRKVVLSWCIQTSLSDQFRYIF